ncbi:MAG TPA: molybdopterin-binding protein [Pseudonocardiaceae bacterium]|nr:molybdopterin-binding protein [Pseudonocardiaceae bacterium]
MTVTWPAFDIPIDGADGTRSPQDGADPVVQSFQVWMQTCLGSGWVPVTDAELVEVAAAGGRVTVDPVRAVWSVPAYRAAAMDGIAVRAASTGIATPQRPVTLPPGEFDVVDTGDLMPDGRDAVIMREYVRHLDNGGVEIDNSVAPGRHVRAIGEDIQAGRIVLPAGHRIRPVDIAALAAAGHCDVRVRRRPVVSILATGDEVRPVGTVLAPGEVLDTNSLMLAGMAEEAGGEARRLRIVPDRPGELAQAVAVAAQHADVVLVIAGSSAGRGDHTAAVVRRLGLVAVHGVAIRPGHPVLLGLLSCERPVPVVGVPGYPASAERAFTCFVLPLLRLMLGAGISISGSAGDGGLPARLACAVSSAGHLDEYLRLRLARIIDPRTGQQTLVAAPLQRGAGALNSIVQTEAILRIPAGTTGLPAGAEVRPVPVAGAAFAASTTIISGLRSPATDALLEIHRDEVSQGSLHWSEASVHDAGEALASGLCHAVALVQHQGAGGGVADPIAVLAGRIGELRVMEIARTASTGEVLVVPAFAFDTKPIATLRAVLHSPAFQRKLLECGGYRAHRASPDMETYRGDSVLACRLAR